MKLCRFELASAPGFPRSGIVYGSKVYETDGANAVGVHEWADVRLLAPLGQPSSVRLFTLPEEGATWDLGSDIPVAPFEYLNSSALIGPSVALPKPEYTTSIHALPCVGVVIGGAGKNVSADEADGLVLGLTLGCVLYSPKDAGGRARDGGFAVGPALTTPDELDDAVTVDERGRRYRFGLTMRHNTEELGVFDMSSLPHTIAEMISYASESCPLVQGDLILIPCFEPGKAFDSGDEIQVFSDKLGALTTRLI